MIRTEDPVRIVVPRSQALALARACTLQMREHRWSEGNVAAARAVLAGDGGAVLLDALRRRLDRSGPAVPGWAVLALPARLGDEELQRAAAGVLAAVGTPFFSISEAGRLWIGAESSTAKDAASFGGTGAQALHIDAPNVEAVPECTCLLVLRPDPAGGGASVLGDLHAALAAMGEADRAVLRLPVFCEGRAEGLHGVGAPRMPFPVLEDDAQGRPRWVRWAGKMTADERNAAHRAVLDRFAAALADTAVAVTLGRGQLLILDQRRIAHGRTALGCQDGWADGSRRWIVQAKITCDPAAPLSPAGTGAGRHGDG
jgi:alpha-ketoglutarate-dependent taurine dioxygenase